MNADAEDTADVVDELVHRNQDLKDRLSVAEQVLRQALHDLKLAHHVGGIRYASRDSIEKFFARNEVTK